MNLFRAAAPTPADLSEIDLEANITPPSPTLDDFDARTTAIESELSAISILLPLPNSSSSSSSVSTLVSSPPSSATLARVDDHVARARSALARLAGENRRLHAGPSTRKIRATRVQALATTLSATVARVEEAREAARAQKAMELKREIDDMNPGILDKVPMDKLRTGVPEDIFARMDLGARKAELVARNSELERLANGVAELRELFVDLGLMVMEQQSIVNEVEGHVHEATGNTEKGADQLEQAVRYRRWARRKKIIALVVLTIILVAIAIVIVLQVTG